MSLMDSVFWWTGAAIAVAACVALAATALYVAAYAVKKACDVWWDRTLTIYRLESLRYYFSIMVANGRTGLLREVDASRREATGSPLKALRDDLETLKWAGSDEGWDLAIDAVVKEIDKRLNAKNEGVKP